MWKVYGLVDPRDERIRYVGCTTMRLLCNRLSAHVSHASPPYRGHTAARSQWIREVLASGHRPTIVLLQSAFTAEEGAEVERQWIARLKDDLVNQSPGGPGLPSPAPEVRAKLSAAQKRIWAERSDAEKAERIRKLRANAWTPEANAKRAASRSWWRPTEESKAKMRAAKLGSRATPEAKANMAAAQKARRQRERESRP